MALQDDLKNAGEHWRGSTKTWKAIMIIGTFMAITPLASLSESIVKWRGFFKDGLEFYEFQLLVPLEKQFKGIGLDLNGAELNELIIFYTVVGSVVRVLFKQSNTDWTVKPFRWIGFILILYAIGLTIVMGSSIDWPTSTAGTKLIRLLISPALFLFFAYAPAYGMSFWPKWRTSLLASYFTILMALFIVFIAAAINVGLLKPI